MEVEFSDFWKESEKLALDEKPKVPSISTVKQLEVFHKQEPQSLSNVIKAHTWNAQPFGLTHGGKCITVALCAAALGYGAYKIIPKIKRALVGKLDTKRHVDKKQVLGRKIGAVNKN